MTTRLYLVRHGATVLSAEDRFAGSTDVELSDEGRAQAAALGRRLADAGLVAAYCSPLRRTVETATLITHGSGLTPQPADGLREITHGHWEGLTRAEVEQRYAAEYASWELDPFTFAPQGGDSGLSVLSRALPVVREIVVTHQDQNVLVVSHKATLRLILSSLLGFDARGYRDRLDQHPACLNIVDFRDPVRARLMLFNDTSHYQDQPGRAHGRLSKWWDVNQPANKTEAEADNEAGAASGGSP
ncbi:MAG: histidine phosphatase family protein [Anaerolineales bacterium]|nr:histidine phosphatase family protein [Anaerolineales bacterium]